ncbi:exodeoxyribonuclease V subunit alpha [Aliidiomarina sanyensis]|uniref:RecBCD enzyme subunit RecD n=1 Tax=Aliidiomarina sanyensis TaxID=1249555 RepID=A0A432WK66_9GAMM|nr:exodeoxyribonuclease V subunit alpha [Aliidiomarina sanyensis]
MGEFTVKSTPQHVASGDEISLRGLLQAMVDTRLIRAIDAELPALLHRMAPETRSEVWLLCALVSFQYGRGHTCIPWETFCKHADQLLGIDEGALARLSERQQKAWRTHLRALQEMSSAALLESPWIAASAGEQGVVQEAPLTWSQGRFYLTRLFLAERQVRAAVTARLQPLAFDSDVLQAAIAEVFEPDQVRVQGVIHWQSLACALAAQRPFTIITGGPGTGKTTTVVRLLAVLQRVRAGQARIQLAAPTGKAAARLTESIRDKIQELPDGLGHGIPAEVVTLHKLLGARPHRRAFLHNRHNPLQVDVVVVDEASMIDVEMMASLMDALPPQAQVILLGDKDQLASVEAGSVLGDFCAGAERGGYRKETLDLLLPYTTGDLNAFAGAGSDYNQATVMLRESHRFGADSGIGQLAGAINRGESVQSDFFERFADIQWFEGTEALDALRKLCVTGYASYLKTMQTGPIAQGASDSADTENTVQRQADIWAKQVLRAHRDFQVLVALRTGPWGISGLNETIADWLNRAGLIAQTHGWYVGRPVIVQRNNYALKLMNGDIGLTVRDPISGSLRVVFEQPDGQIKWVLPSRLADVETVYALTVHKSQGSEFTHTVLVLPDAMNPVLTRELVYTGITRASHQFTLVTPEARILAQAIQTRVIRSSGL